MAAASGDSMAPRGPGATGRPSWPLVKDPPALPPPGEAAPPGLPPYWPDREDPSLSLAFTLSRALSMAEGLGWGGAAGEAPWAAAVPRAAARLARAVRDSWASWGSAAEEREGGNGVCSARYKEKG